MAGTRSSTRSTKMSIARSITGHRGQPDTYRVKTGSFVSNFQRGTKSLAGPQAGNIRTVWRVRQQWVGDITRHARCPARTEPGLYFKFQPEVMQRHRNHSAASRTRTTTESNRTSVFGGAQIPADTARHLSCRQQRTSALLPFPVALAKSSASKVVTLTVSHRHPHNHP